MKATDLIRLRAIEPEDLEWLYGIENDRRLWSVGATNVPYSRYTLHDYIANSSDDIYTDRQVRLLVENERQEAVGMADLVRFDPQHMRAEAGIVIQDGFRRRGYALAALEALADYARRIIHLHQLYAVIAEDNQAALQLFAKAGYRQGLVLHDWLFDGQSYKNAVLMQSFL